MEIVEKKKNPKLVWVVSGFETLTGIVRSPWFWHNTPEPTAWWIGVNGKNFLSTESVKNERYQVKCRLFNTVVGPRFIQADVSMHIAVNRVIIPCETKYGFQFSSQREIPNVLKFHPPLFISKDLYPRKFESEFEDNWRDEFEKELSFVFNISSAKKEEYHGDKPAVRRLSKELLNLYTNQLFSDFELGFSTGNSIRVHRVILGARMPKLMEQLNLGDDPTRSIETEKVISFELLQELMLYIYSGNLGYVQRLLDSVLRNRLLVAVEDLDLYHLKKHICQEIRVESWGRSYKVVMKCSLPLVKFDINRPPCIFRECIFPMSGSATLQLGCTFKPDDFGMMWLYVRLDLETDEDDTINMPINIQWRLYIETSEKYFFGEYLYQEKTECPTEWRIEKEIASLRMLMNPKLPFRANKELQLTFYIKVSRLEFGSSISENETIKFLEGHANIHLDDYTDGLFQNQNFSDCTMTSGASRFRAHKAILATRSPFFKNLFRNQDYDSYNVNINSTLNNFMYFVYTAKIHGHLSPQAVDVLKADLIRYQFLAGTN